MIFFSLLIGGLIGVLTFLFICRAARHGFDDIDMPQLTRPRGKSGTIGPLVDPAPDAFPLRYSSPYVGRPIGTEGVINGRPWRRGSDGTPIYGYQPTFHFGDEVEVTDGLYEGMTGTISTQVQDEYGVRLKDGSPTWTFAHIAKKYLRLISIPPQSHSVICKCDECMKGHPPLGVNTTLNQRLLRMGYEPVPNGNRPFFSDPPHTDTEPVVGDLAKSMVWDGNKSDDSNWRYLEVMLRNGVISAREASRAIPERAMIPPYETALRASDLQSEQDGLMAIECEVEYD